MLTKDTLINNNTSYEALTNIFSEAFPIADFDVDINSRFALISLICYTTNVVKKQQPKATNYSVLKAITKGKNYPEDILKGIACICDGFSYKCKEFPTFNIKGSEIINNIYKIMDSYLPF